MRCMFCDFETRETNEDDQVEEMNRHVNQMHPEIPVPGNLCLRIVDLHHKHNVTIPKLVKEYFQARKEFGLRFKKDIHSTDVPDAFKKA